MPSVVCLPADSSRFGTGGAGLRSTAGIPILVGRDSDFLAATSPLPCAGSVTFGGSAIGAEPGSGGGVVPVSLRTLGCKAGGTLVDRGRVGVICGIAGMTNLLEGESLAALG